MKFLALATLLLTACAQLLVAAFAEEVSKLAPRPTVESDFYLDTTPYLSDGAPDGYRDLPAITRRPLPPPDAPREVFPSPLAKPEADLAKPALRQREP